MKNEMNKLEKACDGGQADSQRHILDLQKENAELQQENAQLLRDKQNLILDLKQSKLDMTELRINYKKQNMVSEKKILSLTVELANINKRPTVAELMSNLGKGSSSEETAEAEAQLIAKAEKEVSERMKHMSPHLKRLIKHDRL